MLRLADATWTDVRDHLAAHPGALVLLPVGALEAHGPHLPLATDVIIAEGMARRAAMALEARGRRVAVAPPVVYSVTEYAGDFPGTASLAPDVAGAHLASVIQALARAGFRRLVVANAHLEPGHVQVLRETVASCRGAGLDVALADKTERRFARTLTDEYKRAECHAGSYETSLVLAERPDLVRDDRRAALPPVRVNLATAMKEGKRTFAEAGAPEAYFGDPASATAAEGEWIYQRLVDMIITVVDEAWPAATP